MDNKEIYDRIPIVENFELNLVNTDPNLATSVQSK